MKILFVVASDVQEAFDIADAPIGLGFIISFAQSKGHNFSFKVIFSPSFDNDFTAYSPDLVAISAFSVTYGTACDIARKCKDAAIPCIVGGIHISLLPKSLSKDFSLGVVGEGEQTFADLLNKFIVGHGWDYDDLKNISGLVYFENELLTITPPRPLIENLDDLPFPVDLSAMQTTNRMTAISSRGCPYRCVFCAPSRLWKKVRSNSPEYMVKHMENYIQSHPGVHQIKLWDDLFSVNKERLTKFANLCSSSKILASVKFFVLCRVDSIDEETIALFKKMNVSDIHLGIESGCQKTLDYIGKKYTVQKAASVLNTLSREAFLTEASYIIGFPNESYQDAMETFTFIKKYQKGLFRVLPLTPLPATPIWDIALSKGVVSEDATMEWERLGMVVKGNGHEQFMNGKFPLVIDAMTREEFSKAFEKIERYRKRLRYFTFVQYFFKQPWRILDFVHYKYKFLRSKQKVIENI